jgi:hypothetical protein
MNPRPDPLTPLSIDAGARLLGCDRRTLKNALRANPEIEPADREGVRNSPRWRIVDHCEALEIFRICQAPADRRRYCERYAADLERALALPCPRCGGNHPDMPIMPLPGKSETPEILRWFAEHSFPERYPEGGPDHPF